MLSGVQIWAVYSNAFAVEVGQSANTSTLPYYRALCRYHAAAAIKAFSLTLDLVLRSLGALDAHLITAALWACQPDLDNDDRCFCCAHSVRIPLLS